MNIVVTGASGLLGKPLVAALLQAGHHVKALTRSESSSLQGEVVIGDIELPESLVEPFRGADLIIHAAALVSFDPRDRHRLHAVNARGTRHVVDACLLAGVQRLIHVSSVAAIGAERNAVPITETTPWPEAGDDRISGYGRSKYEAELEVFRGAAEGLTVHLVNPSVILAPRGSGRSSDQLLKYAFSGPLFYTDGNLNLVDLRDVVAAILSLVESGSHAGERFILSSGAISWKEFLSAIARRRATKPPAISAARWLVHLAVLLARLKSVVTGNPPGLTRETARAAFSRNEHDGSKAVRMLGIAYTPLEETLDWIAKS